MKNKFKNQLFHLTRELGFSPSDFQLSYDEEENLDIKYSNSPLSFKIRESDDEFDKFDCCYITYSPQYLESDYYPQEVYGDFQEILKIFKNWVVNEIKAYIDGQEDEEDLWDAYKNGNSSFEFANNSFVNQDSFSADEVQQIGIAINELKFLINSNISLNFEHQQIVNNRLNYLVENVGRLNKFEWKSLLLSTLIGIATTLTLDAEKGRLLFEFLKRVFGSFPKLII